MFKCLDRNNRQSVPQPRMLTYAPLTLLTTTDAKALLDKFSRVNVLHSHSQWRTTPHEHIAGKRVFTPSFIWVINTSVANDDGRGPLARGIHGRPTIEAVTPRVSTGIPRGISRDQKRGESEKSPFGTLSTTHTSRCIHFFSRILVGVCTGDSSG